MFLSKKTSIHLPKRNFDSKNVVFTRACFFKIFITELHTEFFPYSDSKAILGSKEPKKAKALRVSTNPAFSVEKQKHSQEMQIFLKCLALQEKNCQIIRPLLHLSRTEISLICKTLFIPVHPDISNQSIKYSRNRIRKQLLPSLKLFYNPQIEQALFQFAEFVCKEQDFIAILTNALPHH